MLTLFPKESTHSVDDFVAFCAEPRKTGLILATNARVVDSATSDCCQCSIHLGEERAEETFFDRDIRFAFILSTCVSRRW